MTKFNQFLRNEEGAVTIDWVALTAAVVLLGLFVVYAIFETGLSGLATSINTNLGEVSAINPDNSDALTNLGGNN
ncbi:MAG: hypothetical protein AAF713_16340 [Pseudomonadota bacterium]